MTIPAPGDDDCGAARGSWTEVVRRTTMPPHYMLVALLAASYGAPDGTRVYPGVARLAAESGLDYRTVRRALAWLRAAGLLQVTRRGARKSGQSDEYRLTLAPDLLERCEVASPEEHQRQIQKIRDRARRSSTGHQ